MTITINKAKCEFQMPLLACPISLPICPGFRPALQFAVICILLPKKTIQCLQLSWLNVFGLWERKCKLNMERTQIVPPGDGTQDLLAVRQPCHLIIIIKTTLIFLITSIIIIVIINSWFGTSNQFTFHFIVCLSINKSILNDKNNKRECSDCTTDLFLKERNFVLIIHFKSPQAEQINNPRNNSNLAQTFARIKQSEFITVRHEVGIARSSGGSKFAMENTCTDAKVITVEYLGYEFPCKIIKRNHWGWISAFWDVWHSYISNILQPNWSPVRR